MGNRKRIQVGILGSTGMVGQQLIQELTDHPWFELTWLGASERSAGRQYTDVTDWRLPTSLSSSLGNLIVQSSEPTGAPHLMFSGVDASAAGQIESAFANAGHMIVSNARNHRMEECVPLLIPEVNPDHLGLLCQQKKRKGWAGGVVTNPNCSTIVLAMALAPLRGFGIRSVIVTTLQAISGAGYPGVASYDIVGNVIPVVPGEEDKMEQETQKILGTFIEDRIELHPMTVSAHTTRVSVIDGHTVTVSVKFEKAPTLDELRAAFEEFTGSPQEQELPSAPKSPIVYLNAEDRPQPRLDAQRGHGMTVSIGRLRECKVLDIRFVALGHNTVRGAAGAAVLNAELLYSQGLLS
tara:strand:- start:2891 stop:3946 length:1056 start_codon:yes stop_codon:yes gene_type:complete